MLWACSHTIRTLPPAWPSPLLCRCTCHTEHTPYRWGIIIYSTARTTVLPSLCHGSTTVPESPSGPTPPLSCSSLGRLWLLEGPSHIRIACDFLCPLPVADNQSLPPMGTSLLPAPLPPRSTREQASSCFFPELSPLRSFSRSPTPPQCPPTCHWRPA